MRRRDVITGVASVVALQGFANAQHGIRRIAMLLASAEDDPVLPRFIAAVEQGLQSLGWKPGSNVQIDVRVSGFDPKRLQTHANELLALKPEAVLVLSTVEIRAIRAESATVPVVFVGNIDPAAEPDVQSIARPGGYTTGFINYEASIAAKWLDLLKQVMPTLHRVGMILNHEARQLIPLEKAVVAAAPSFAVELTKIGDTDDAIIRSGIEHFASAPGGLIIFPGASTIAHRDLVIDLSIRHHLPAIYPFASYARAGGLMFYGVDQIDQFRRAASYVDQILRGAKPGDLPIQGPVKFTFVVNLKTARAMGVPVPATLLTAADEVIE